MVNIYTSQTNILVLTLTEKVTLEEPFFLFVFTNEQTRHKSYCVAADESEFRQRYNKFIITESDSPDPLNGEVTLQPAGTWRYEVYEQSEATNLDPENAAVVTLLETGIARVVGTPATHHTYSPDSEINYIYEG